MGTGQGPRLRLKQAEEILPWKKRALALPAKRATVLDDLTREQSCRKKKFKGGVLGKCLPLVDRG